MVVSKVADVKNLDSDYNSPVKALKDLDVRIKNPNELPAPPSQSSGLTKKPRSASANRSVTPAGTGFTRYSNILQVRVQLIFRNTLIQLIR